VGIVPFCERVKPFSCENSGKRGTSETSSSKILVDPLTRNTEEEKKGKNRTPTAEPSRRKSGGSCGFHEASLFLLQRGNSRMAVGAAVKEPKCPAGCCSLFSHKKKKTGSGKGFLSHMGAPTRNYTLLAGSHSPSLSGEKKKKKKGLVGTELAPCAVLLGVVREL